MTNAEPGVKVALYVRVSGEEQKQGHNIDSQIAELRQFAAQREWTVFELYSDEAWSGAALARPALDKLRDDAGKKLFDAVLINDVDRLARDVTHLGIIKRDLERSGVRVIFRKIPSENSPTHNLLVNILGSFAEFERELIMDRTRRGRRHKVETRQEFIGCIAPYGYRYTPARKPEQAGQLAVHLEEATIVREMYHWVDSLGISARDVALRLGGEGLRPRKGGPSWGRSSVLRILRGSIYRGTWNYNKHQGCYPRSVHPEAEARARKSSTRLRPREEWIPVSLPNSLQIISPDQWQRVQQQLDRNRSFSPRNSQHQYLLSGLVRCGGCGSRYVGNPSHGQFQYRCIKRCKRLPLISERALDSSVWAVLKRALDNPALLTKAVTCIPSPEVVPDTDVNRMKAAIAAIDMEESRLLEAYRLSVLTAEQLARELGLIASRRQLLQREQRTIAQRVQPVSTVQPSVEDYCRQIRQRLETVTFETKRSVLRLLVRSVVFEGDQVRIKGVIPLPNSGGVANTEVHSRGHNPASDRDIADTMVDSCARNPAALAEFTLLGVITRSREAAIAASRANLVKANATWRRLRLRSRPRNDSQGAHLRQTES